MLRDDGPQSRAELARRTALSPTTLTDLRRICSGQGPSSNSTGPPPATRPWAGGHRCRAGARCPVGGGIALRHRPSPSLAVPPSRHPRCLTTARPVHPIALLPGRFSPRGMEG
ncbi:hypothetical protein [Mesorhizobium australicum]|uniref:hypothetical protein n=1 Tax=Mesorhizobium australicum TaxID=536018 RepID=UPI001427D3FF